MTAHYFPGTAPLTSDYEQLSFGASRGGVFPRSSGTASISIDGRETTHVTLNAGVIVNPVYQERVCFAASAQPTIDAQVTLHSYLTHRP